MFLGHCGKIILWFFFHPTPLTAVLLAKTVSAGTSHTNGWCFLIGIKQENGFHQSIHCLYLIDGYISNGHGGNMDDLPVHQGAYTNGGIWLFLFRWSLKMLFCFILLLNSVSQRLVCLQKKLLFLPDTLRRQARSEPVCRHVMALILTSVHNSLHKVG